MKIFYIITIVLSLVLGAYSFMLVIDSARDQARIIEQTKALTMQEPHRAFVNQKQLAEYPKQFVRSYEDAIKSSNNMRRYFNKDTATCQLLALLLFITSIAGLIGCKKKEKKTVSNKTLDATSQ
jgi:hypothetical protein